MPRKPEEVREETDGQVKATRRRSTATSPDVTEAKPPTSVGANSVNDAAPAPTLPVTETPHGAEEEIRRRAYELYERDGRLDGRDREHWLLAETEILGRSAERHRKRGQKSA